MQIITTREFRANQKKYFELAETESVFVTRKNGRPILISVAKEDDYLASKKAEAENKKESSYAFRQGETLSDFLNRIVQDEINKAREEFKQEAIAAFRQVKDHSGGKIKLQTAEAFIDELRNSSY